MLNMYNYLYNDREDKESYQNTLEKISQKVWDFFIEDAEKQGFENREGQQDMALDIVDAIKDKQHIVIEAGVGIGKSFAYIVPIVLYNYYFHKPVVIATSTIALQEQLASDLSTVFKILKCYPEVIIAKGQTHFVCERRSNEYLSNYQQENGNLILNEIQSGVFDRKDFKTSFDSKLWSQINIKNYNYKDCSQCNYKKSCYFFNLRNKMKTSDGIIVCNQDLLTIHLQKSRSFQKTLFNENISLIVVDEAHNLEDKVRNSLTIKLSKKYIIGTVRETAKLVKSSNNDLYNKIEKLSDKLNALYSLFEKQIQSQIDDSPFDMKYADKFFVKFSSELLEILMQLSEIISAINSDIDIYLSSLNDDYLSDNIFYATENLEDIVNFFEIAATKSNHNLYWLEKCSRNITFVSCPKNISEIANQLYFNRSHSTIMTSATITNSIQGDLEEQYSYFMKNTGFPIDDTGFLSGPKPSPFPYDKNALLYYCDDLPHPTQQREEFLKEGTKRLIELLNASNGKALVLFTAKTDLEYVYNEILEMKLPFKILVQQNHASQEKVLTLFRDDTNSVLLGTGAYWEGINIEGISLSNLVIFRLPFPVPDPIIEYKRSIAKDALMDVNVPEMIIKLKQGIGRLIRNHNDKGIVSIIDSRLGDSSNVPYKELVWDALPIKNKTCSINELAEFYNNVVVL